MKNLLTTVTILSVLACNSFANIRCLEVLKQVNDLSTELNVEKLAGTNLYNVTFSQKYTSMSDGQEYTNTMNFDNLSCNINGFVAYCADEMKQKLVKMSTTEKKSFSGLLQQKVDKEQKVIFNFKTPLKVSRDFDFDARDCKITE